MSLFVTAPFAGLVRDTAGAVVSIVHDACAGVGSAVPEATARTWNEWLPSTRPVYCCGLEHATHGPPSNPHWKLLPATVEANANDPNEDFTIPDGLDVIVVSGGVTGGGAEFFKTTFPATEQFSFSENRCSWLFTSRQTNNEYVPAAAAAGTFAPKVSLFDLPAANPGRATRSRLVSAPREPRRQLNAPSVDRTRLRDRFATVAIPEIRPADSRNDTPRTTNGNGNGCSLA